MEQYRSKRKTPDLKNIRQGLWGEAQAEVYLKAKGWKLLARNARPCAADRRCEIDRIFLSSSTLVFVEVKTHLHSSPYSNRLSAITSHKKSLLLRAASAYLLSNHYHGSFRFDVVEVWGDCDSPTPPRIDHLENVPLFPPQWRFW